MVLFPLLQKYPDFSFATFLLKKIEELLAYLD